ncbi:MAG: hypothetical protein JNL39_16830 [Opitutaceae bacterium]|nr:hypothetical protein [Opitutaceae bacterium]
MKKSSKSFLVLAAASLFAAGLIFAGDAPANKAGGCCTKAAKNGQTCAHPCCVEAAKAGNNCTKCGGSGKIVKADKK